MRDTNLLLNTEIDTINKNIIETLSNTKEITTSNSILVIDDEELFLISINRLLKRHDYNCFSANNGEDGIKIINNNPIDIVLLDLKLPYMNGIDILKIIRKSHPHIKIIIITGCSTIMEAVKTIKMGAIDLIEKPLHDMVLINKLKLIDKNVVIDKVDMVLLTLILELTKYFNEENTIMLNSNYHDDYYLQHKEEHVYFIKLLTSMVLGISTLKYKEQVVNLYIKIINFCTQWLGNHLLTSNKDLITFLNNEALCNEKN